MEVPERVIRRVVNKVERDLDGGCLISTYAVGSHGYPAVAWATLGRHITSTAHRVAWVAYFGSIPPGQTVDHICHVRRCIEPTHLRLLSHSLNASYASRTRKVPMPTTRRCLRGHVILQYASGETRCRECKSERARTAA